MLTAHVSYGKNYLPGYVISPLSFCEGALQKHCLKCIVQINTNLKEKLNKVFYFNR